MSDIIYIDIYKRMQKSSQRNQKGKKIFKISIQFSRKFEVYLPAYKLHDVIIYFWILNWNSFQFPGCSPHVLKLWQWMQYYIWVPLVKVLWVVYT